MSRIALTSIISMEIKLLITFVVASNLCAIAMSSEVETAFIANEVVPDAVDVAPQEELKVTYPSGVSVNLGNELTPTSVKDVPKVEWKADADQLYTLLMVDPDPPSRAQPTFRSIKHWAVLNIPGSDVAKGDEIAEYIGVGAPKGTGLHRYVFLVYKQANGKITYDGATVTNRSRQDRLKWSAADFAKQYNLGIPIAGNFFQGQYDDYVPILQAQLSGN